MVPVGTVLEIRDLERDKDSGVSVQCNALCRRSSVIWRTERRMWTVLGQFIDNSWTECAALHVSWGQRKGAGVRAVPECPGKIMRQR